MENHNLIGESTEHAILSPEGWDKQEKWKKNVENSVSNTYLPRCLTLINDLTFRQLCLLFIKHVNSQR